VDNDGVTREYGAETAGELEEAWAAGDALLAASIDGREYLITFERQPNVTHHAMQRNQVGGQIGLMYCHIINR
jgi:hypothetical protein